MNKFRLLYVFIYLFLICCNVRSNKYSKQLELVNKLLISFSKNDTLTVKGLLGVPPEEIGSDNESVIWDVGIANKIIKEYGIPDESKFLLKEYPEKNPNLLDVVVPLVKEGKGRLKNAEITISFVKWVPSDKILNFHVNTTYEPLPTIAPDSLRNVSK